MSPPNALSPQIAACCSPKLPPRTTYPPSVNCCERQPTGNFRFACRCYPASMTGSTDTRAHPRSPRCDSSSNKSGSQRFKLSRNDGRADSRVPACWPTAQGSRFRTENDIGCSATHRDVDQDPVRFDMGHVLEEYAVGSCIQHPPAIPLGRRSPRISHTTRRSTAGRCCAIGRSMEPCQAWQLDHPEI